MPSMRAASAVDGPRGLNLVGRAVLPSGDLAPIGTTYGHVDVTFFCQLLSG